MLGRHVPDHQPIGEADLPAIRHRGPRPDQPRQSVHVAADDLGQFLGADLAVIAAPARLIRADIAETDRRAALGVLQQEVFPHQNEADGMR